MIRVIVGMVSAEVEKKAVLTSLVPKEKLQTRSAIEVWAFFMVVQRIMLMDNHHPVLESENKIILFIILKIQGLFLILIFLLIQPAT